MIYIMLDTTFWKKYFKVYDVLNYVIPYQELLEEIVKELDIKEGDLILDAGVGTGNLAILLEKRGAKVIGIDFSQEALNIYKNKNPKAKIILADLNEKLPLDDEIFDKVVSNNTLYNIPRHNRLETARELKRVLKPNGKIVLSNIHKRYKPIKIYLATIMQNIKRSGFIDTISLVAKLIIPTIKIFYYNFQIQKVHKINKRNLFVYHEQEKLLKDGGFYNISKTKFVYANQGILNSATKP